MCLKHKMESHLELIEHLFTEIRLESVTTEIIDLCKERLELASYHLENYKRRYEECTQKIDALQESYRELQQRRLMPTTLWQLIEGMENPHQKETLRKITPEYSRNEEDQIYLNSFTQNTSTERKWQSLAGTFEVLGCMKKGVRTHYDVRLYKPNANEKGSLWCSCSDHKFHSIKHNKVCKHICFIVCKVAKMYDPAYFESKQLSEEQFNKLMEKATNLNTFKDITICRVPDTVTIELFQDKSKPISHEDTCPICYDDLNEETFSNTCLSCPSCHNYVHKDCMHVWLERKDNCVYCRNDIWKKYKTAIRV